MDYYRIETEEERVANIHYGCWPFLLFVIILSIDLFLELYINYSGVTFMCHEIFNINICIWWVHLSLIVVSIYSYCSMRYESPIWSCTLKCLISCAGLWFLIVVLKIMLSSTNEVTSQSFAQTVDEMILLLSALVIIVGGDQYNINLKKIIEDINNKMDKRINKNINITNKSDVIQ